MSSRDRLSGRQLGALALTAAGFPAFRFCARVPWPWVLLGSLIAAALLSALTAYLNRARRRDGSQPSATEPDSLRRRKNHPCLQGRGTGLQAGEGVPPPNCLPWFPLLLPPALLAAWESTRAFPETAGNLLAAALVLGLAAFAAWTGPVAVGRCAGILLWITGLLYGTVLIFSLPQARLDWLRPTGDLAQTWPVPAALLAPGAALCLTPVLGEDQRLPHWPWWTAAALGTASSAVTGAILSPALQGEAEAFRTLARGVSVLGVIRRFEALVNGAMLMSGFTLCALYLVALGCVMSRYRAFPEKRKKSGKMQKMYAVK